MMKSGTNLAIISDVNKIGKFSNASAVKTKCRTDLCHDSIELYITTLGVGITDLYEQYGEGNYKDNSNLLPNFYFFFSPNMNPTL